MNHPFGHWLRQHRKERGLTQAEVAQWVHCAEITIRKIEAGERHPSIQVAQLLADCFALPLHARATFYAFARTGALPKLPHTLENASLSPPFPFEAAAAYLVEAETGLTLLNHQGQQRFPMASTTKIMTTLVALERGDLNQLITIEQESLDEVQRCGGYCIGLVVGDRLLLRDLLYALMLASGDEVALTVAKAISGSTEAFVHLMNAYAQRLNLRRTHYITPSGMTVTTEQGGTTHTGHTSTAEDLVHLTRYALTHRHLAQIVQLQRYVVPQTATHRAYLWESTNALLSSYAGATGIKTGYSAEAGYCLVFSATSNHHQLIGALLGASTAQQRTLDASRLLDWGFETLALAQDGPFENRFDPSTTKKESDG